MLKRCLLAALASVAVMSAGTEAGTIGYWRFEKGEGGFLADRGPKGLALTNENDVRQAALESDSPFAPGLSFPNPVPQTGERNLKAALLEGNNCLSHEPHQAFNKVKTFTVEAYINANVSEQTQAIIGQYGAGKLRFPERRWMVALEDGKKLRVNVSHDGSRGKKSDRAIVSEPMVEPNEDYFVAVVIEVNDEGTTAHFYAQKLGDGGEMNKDTGSDEVITELHDSKAALTIGAIGTQPKGERKAYFSGLIDEVRLSKGKLTPSQFLNASPENEK